MRATTPGVECGLSSRADLIQASDFCWPQTVGMRKGTGDRDQQTTRQLNPARKIARVPYGRATASSGRSQTNRLAAAAASAIASTRESAERDVFNAHLAPARPAAHRPSGAVPA